MRPRFSLRPLTGVIDAGASSVGNLLLSIVAAHELPLSRFGELSVALLICLVTTGVSRCLLGDPLVLTHSAEDAPVLSQHSHQVAGTAVSTALLMSPVVAVIVFVAVKSSGGTTGDAAGLGSVAAAAAPLYVLQELFRAIAYASNRPWAAVANSSAWTLSLALSLWLLTRGPSTQSPTLLLLAWSTTTAFGVAIGSVSTRVRIRPTDPRPWWRTHRRLSRTLIMDYGLTQTTAESAFVLVGLIAGSAQVGLLRKAQLPLAPVPVITNGIAAMAQPRMVRAVANGARPQDVSRLAYGLGAAVSTIALVLGLAVFFLPTTWVDLAVGGDWEQARHVVLPMSCFLSLGALAACQGIALRALGRVAAQVRLRLGFAPISLGVVCLASLGGARGAAIGLCATVFIVVAGWAWLLHTTRPTHHR